MDPLSIVARPTALATFAFKASALIYSGIESTKVVDTTISQLHSEVEALANSLKGIASTYQSPEVISLLSGSKSQPAARLLGSVKPLLEDCKKSLGVLGSELEGIQGKPGNLDQLLRKPKMAVRLHFGEGDLEGLRHQTRSYSGAMRMTLQMVVICLTLDEKSQFESLGASLSMQLSNLSEQMASVQKQLSQYRETSSSKAETLVQDRLQKQHLQHHSNSGGGIDQRYRVR